MTNLWGKRRRTDDPYLTLFVDDWIYRVLQARQPARGDVEMAYARWYCQVITPQTGPRGDLGDVYVSTILQAAHIVKLEQALLEVIYGRQRAEMKADQFRLGVCPRCWGTGTEWSVDEYQRPREEECRDCHGSGARKGVRR